MQVTYTDAHGTAEGPLTSAQTAAVVNVNDAPAGVPSITGTAQEDQVLTADTSGISDDDGLGTFSYQWLRNGVAITGATSGTYTLGDADVGTQVSVQVTYTDAHGTAEGPLTSAQTAAVVNVNDTPTGVPTITGTVQEDQTLTADTSGISDDDGLGAFSYQWLRDGATIFGATSSTYTLGDADVGTQVSVQITYIDSQGTSEGPLTSAQTAAVTNVPDPAVITGTDNGFMTEDGDPDFDGLLEAAAALAVSDPDPGEAAFNAGTFAGSYGSLTIDAAGNWSYSIDNSLSVVQSLGASETLIDTIAVTTIDGTAHTITLTILGDNDAPTSSGIADVAVMEDAAPSFIDLLSAFADIDDGVSGLSFTVANSSNPALFASQTIDTDTGQLHLDFAANANGASTLTVRATDPSGEQVDTTFSVTVTAVNDTPAIGSLQAITLGIDEVRVIDNHYLSATDVDNAADEIRFTLTSTPAHGDLLRLGTLLSAGDSFTQDDINAGRVLYHARETGTDTFEVVVSDNSGSQGPSATLRISVDAQDNETAIPPEFNAADPNNPDDESNPDNDQGTKNESEIITPNTTSPTLPSNEVSTLAPDLGESPTLPHSATFETTHNGDVNSTQRTAAPLRVVRELLNTATAPKQNDLANDPLLSLEQVADPTRIDRVSLANIQHATARAFEQLDKDLGDKASESALVLRSVGGVSVSLSAGYLVWLLRSGSLLTAMMATMPVWRGFDPLFVIARAPSNTRTDDDDSKSVREILDYASPRPAVNA